MGLGLEIRAQIDSENAKSLLLINGGAAVALLAFLPSILGKPDLASVSRSVVYALCLFLVGLAAAFVHNRLRRVCSLVYEGNNFEPPRCRFFPSWLSRREPCVCFVSIAAMWLSLVAFVTGGSVVAFGGFNIISYKDAPITASCWQLQEFQGQIFRINSCTGSFELVRLSIPTHNQSMKADVAKVTPP